MTIGNWDAWNFRMHEGDAWPANGKLVGFSVHAVDGAIGTVADASIEENASWIVVDTGPWIFGHQVVLPAGTIRRINGPKKTVEVDLTKTAVKDAPPPRNEFGTVHDEEFRGLLGAYYGGVLNPR